MDSMLRYHLLLDVQKGWSLLVRRGMRKEVPGLPGATPLVIEGTMCMIRLQWLGQTLRKENILVSRPRYQRISLTQ